MKTFIGARVFKTAIAVLVSILLSERLGLVPVFASTSAYLSMKPSVGLAWNNVKEQLGMQLIAFTFSILFGLVIGPGPIAVFISVIVIFQIAIHFKWTNNMNMGVVSALYILSAPATDFVHQVLLRIAGISLGICVGFVVNVFIDPPEYRSGMISRGLDLENLLMRSLQDAVHAYINRTSIDPDQQALRKTEFKKLYNEMNKNYNLYKNDRFPLFDLGNSEETDLEISFFHDYRDYLKGVTDRIQDVWSWSDGQKKRGEEEEYEGAGQSDELERVLTVLRDALDIAIEKDGLLQDKVRIGTAVPTEPVSVWNKIDEALQSWHLAAKDDRDTLHQLTEISIITQKIQWLISAADSLVRKPPEHLGNVI
ncbi:MAG: aromatic acid exporter family protein [Peptococcaceae bacterium]|jgi:hypothetical protein|nr:aromatic acid exporter family protein [Peptococcaceae bacterium]